jgi:hypothetical protein
MHAPISENQITQFGFWPCISYLQGLYIVLCREFVHVVFEQCPREANMASLAVANKAEDHDRLEG